MSKRFQAEGRASRKAMKLGSAWGTPGSRTAVAGVAGEGDARQVTEGCCQADPDSSWTEGYRRPVVRAVTQSDFCCKRITHRYLYISAINH